MTRSFVLSEDASLVFLSDKHSIKIKTSMEQWLDGTDKGKQKLSEDTCLSAFCQLHILHGLGRH